MVDGCDESDFSAFYWVLGFLIGLVSAAQSRSERVLLFFFTIVFREGQIFGVRSTF